MNIIISIPKGWKADWTAAKVPSLCQNRTETGVEGNMRPPYF